MRQLMAEPKYSLGLVRSPLQLCLADEFVDEFGRVWLTSGTEHRISAVSEPLENAKEYGVDPGVSLEGASLTPFSYLSCSQEHGRLTSNRVDCDLIAPGENVGAFSPSFSLGSSSSRGRSST